MLIRFRFDRTARNRVERVARVLARPGGEGYAFLVDRHTDSSGSEENERSDLAPAGGGGPVRAARSRYQSFEGSECRLAARAYRWPTTTLQTGEAATDVWRS